MRKFYVLAVAALFFSPATNAEEYELVGTDSFAERVKTPVIPPGVTDDRTLPKTTKVESLPNSEGEKIFCFYRDDIKHDALALRIQKGKIKYLYEIVIWGQPLLAPVTEKILWFGDDEFACVSSGEQNSFFAIYRIQRGDSDFGANAAGAFLVGEGVIHCHVTWKVKDGKLEGRVNGSPYISVLSYEEAQKTSRW